MSMRVHIFRIVASIIVFRIVHSSGGASQFAFYAEFITYAIAKMIGFNSHARIYGPSRYTKS